MAGNREYKSDVFSMLMQDKIRALELYNAMNDMDYDNPDEVEMVTLAGGISLSVRNDASFVVGDNLSIYEHQSTVCPNMALRSLIKIPTPKFVVFYNGAEKQPEEMTQYLSDSFEQKTDDPELELKCKVYNINYGKNRAIMDECRWLDEYMMFVDKVREYHNSKDEEELEDDINKAIDYCIENDILKEFLSERRGEVTKVMALDYTFDKQLEMERAEAWNGGKKEGIEEGRIEGREEGEKIGKDAMGEAMSKLIKKLLEDGNIEEVRHVTSNSEYRDKLLKELGLL